MAGTIPSDPGPAAPSTDVSMESGLDGRNNSDRTGVWCTLAFCLNGVRPRWPEQLTRLTEDGETYELSQWSPA